MNPSLGKRHFTEEVANRIFKFVHFSCGVPQRSICADDMNQAVGSNMYPQMIPSCSSSARKSLKYCKKHLTKDFSNIFDWCVGNKLRIRIFGSTKQNQSSLVINVI